MAAVMSALLVCMVGVLAAGVDVSIPVVDEEWDGIGGGGLGIILMWLYTRRSRIVAALIDGDSALMAPNQIVTNVRLASIEESLEALTETVAELSHTGKDDGKPI